MTFLTVAYLFTGAECAWWYKKQKPGCDTLELGLIVFFWPYWMIKRRFK